jgi:hypothetical protein
MKTKKITFTISSLIAISLFSCGPTNYNTAADARMMMREFIQRRLKNPADADFGFCPVEKLDSVNYKTKCYVDATNSFGAKIRNNFTCQVKYVSGKTWELVELKFEE